MLADRAELLEMGALDGLKKEEISALEPDIGSSVLVTRLRDGSYVKLGEEKILPLMEEKIRLLEAEGAQLIVLLCTGTFPDFQAGVPLIYPQKLLLELVPSFTEGRCIAVVNPSADQLGQSLEKWGGAFQNVLSMSCNPYDGAPGLSELGRKIRSTDAELAVLDCIGYTKEMQEELQAAAGIPVILPRILTAAVIRGFL